MTRQGLTQIQINALCDKANKGFRFFPTPHGNTINALIRRGLLDANGRITEEGKAVAFKAGLNLMKGHNAVVSTSDEQIFCITCGGSLLSDQDLMNPRYKTIKADHSFTCLRCGETSN